mmetsp:Transcript_35509/g.98151  ORF Transcript_35509/g.98151 Transcript_35509/m.98151 type:complete len:252 (+) Transcript_35509:180-935(+)
MRRRPGAFAVTAAAPTSSALWVPAAAVGFGPAAAPGALGGPIAGAASPVASAGLRAPAATSAGPVAALAIPAVSERVPAAAASVVPAVPRRTGAVIGIPSCGFPTADGAVTTAGLAGDFAYARWPLVAGAVAGGGGGASPVFRRWPCGRGGAATLATTFSIAVSRLVLRLLAHLGQEGLPQVVVQARAFGVVPLQCAASSLAHLPHHSRLGRLHVHACLQLRLLRALGVKLLEILEAEGRGQGRGYDRIAR